MNKEIKTDHFKTLNELLKTCKMWIEEEDWYCYNRYFEMQCMEEMYKYIVELQQENEKLNHYKLLYQKVKERNDEALKFVEKFYKIEVTNDLHLMNKIDQTILLGILKGDNNE